MDYKMYLAFFLLGAFLPCNGQANWNDGAIKREGIYGNDEIKIIVSEDNYLLKYTTLKINGDTLFVNPDGISTVHKWALHLDKAGNLWVFSSDRGISAGEELVLVQATKDRLCWTLKKDSIPADVYNTLKEFYPYNQQK